MELEMIYQIVKFKEAYKNYFQLKENQNILQRLDFMTASIDGEEEMIIAKDVNKIIGVHAYTNFNNDFIKISYIQVDKEYQKQGIATELMKILIQWAKENKKGIISSQYSESGQKYVKNQMKKFAQEYDVNYFTSEEEFNWFD